MIKSVESKLRESNRLTVILFLLVLKVISFLSLKCNLGSKIEELCPSFSSEMLKFASKLSEPRAKLKNFIFLNCLLFSKSNDYADFNGSKR